VKGVARQDWQISQVGLSFEHGGAIGSATGNGPIPLASHAGLFLRISQLTGEPLYRDMARAAALGRDAFVDQKTSVASYYWRAMDAGSGPFPHHAWWQIGWITDYLISEASLRSNNQISFPRGFITPKVGPHQSYGFAPGSIFGQKVNLLLREGLVKLGNANVDYVSALAPEKDKLYVVLLNSQAAPAEVPLALDLTKLPAVSKEQPKNTSFISADGKPFNPENKNKVTLPGFGVAVVAVDYETGKK
jgi:hypothetical protein